MKAKSPLFLLLSLSLVLLAPTLTQAFWKKLIKTATLDKKVLAQLETFTSDATGSLEELNKSVHAMVKERRASICCYDVVKQEDKLSLSLRSAIYTAIVALSRLHDATSEYRQQLNQKCGRCDVPPSEVLCNAEDYPCPSEPEKCITPFQQCDGTPDCIDATDEKFENCFKFPCDRDVMCEENQLCIPASYRCDGRYDCPHGSDETTCNIPFTDTPPTTTMVPTEPSITTFTSTSITNELPLQQCDDFQVRCESDSICIPAIWRCDGDMDCKDGSDEASCDTFSPCRDDQFKCVSGDNCLPAEWRCDGEKDCVDGSDEASCATTTATITTPTPTTTCRYDQFKCVSNGNCVPAIWRCDGEEDCMDGSDEASCTTSTTTTATPTPTTTCDDNQLRCESDGTCLPAIWRCDGDEDCDDGSDEASCTTSTTTTTTPPTTCSDDQFKCVSNDNCVPATWRCNGEEDCMDGSDEASCTTITTTTTTPATAQCDDNQLRCESDGTCLPATWRCDGDKDCNDGSDEASCDSHSPDCKETQFKCASGKCVPELWHCDGEEDCDDGSDEADCLESTTTATTKTEAPDTGCDNDQLKCTTSGDCVPGVFRCDGVRDCSDGSDEENCTTVRGEACEGSPCSHRCVSVPWANQGFLCTCPEGMELQVPDRHNCVPTGAKGFKGDISGTKGVKG